MEKENKKNYDRSKYLSEYVMAETKEILNEIKEITSIPKSRLIHNLAAAELNRLKKKKE